MILFLLLAAGGALGGAGEAAEEGHLVFAAGLAGDWFYRGSPVRPFGGIGAPLPGHAANRPALYFANSGLHSGAHVRPGRDGADLFRRLAVGAGPRHAALAALQHAALGGLVVAVALAIFAVTVRASGRAVANLAEKSLSSISQSLGHSVGVEFHAFRDGLDSIATLGDFLRSLGLSLLMWGFISAAYLETTRAFVLSPELSAMTLARCMVLMAGSMVGSVVQLPVLGWFTQIGVTTGVMQRDFMCSSSRRWPAARCCSIVTFMCVIPVGLIWARIEHVPLKKVSEQSEQFAHEDAEATPAVS